MDVRLEVPGHGSIPAYAARADTRDGPRPGVVVVHEMFGLNDDIRQIADRFATNGYHALAPDLMSRAGTVRCLVSLVRSLRAGEGPAFDDLLAARDWLTARPDSTGAVGVAGFCIGGAFAILLAARGFGASAVQYGQLPKDLDAALAGACPVVASYGGRDRSLRGAADRLRVALVAAGVPHDVHEYPDAGHSFMGHAPLPLVVRPVASGLLHAGYVDTAAEDAWTRLLAMFGTALAPN